MHYYIEKRKRTCIVVRYLYYNVTPTAKLLKFVPSWNTSL